MSDQAQMSLCLLRPQCKDCKVVDWNRENSGEEELAYDDFLVEVEDGRVSVVEFEPCMEGLGSAMWSQKSCTLSRASSCRGGKREKETENGVGVGVLHGDWYVGSDPLLYPLLHAAGLQPSQQRAVHSLAV